MAFEIDKDIIEKTSYCQNSFKCLEGDCSHNGHVEIKGKDLLCRYQINKSGNFCYYRIAMEPTRVLCQCYVRREIYRKYKV